MTKRIHLIIFFIIFLGLISYSFVFYSNISRSQEGEILDNELVGYGWNNNIGWISFNCENSQHCEASNYKVVADNDGVLSGYAWSERMGWISFDQSDLDNCPFGECEARINDWNKQFTNAMPLTGWAKILIDNSWIHLFNDDLEDDIKYGARVHSSGSISGYAWSESVGWISFEGENYNSFVKGATNLYPITLTGAGFIQEAIVDLINNNPDVDIREIRCENQNGENTFIVSNDGHTLTGACPLDDTVYGDWDIRVTNPDGQMTMLSGSKSPLFRIMPPTAEDLTIGAPSLAGNNGFISITKINSSNSLIGAQLMLMKEDGEKIYCFTIHSYDSEEGWINGRDENGELLPQQCNLIDIEKGKYNFAITKMENGEEKWTEITENSIDVSCVSREWEPFAPETVTASQIYGKQVMTDNCGTTQIIEGICTPDWKPDPATRCGIFTQTAENCLNKPERSAQGTYSCSYTDGFMCLSNICVPNISTCNQAWVDQKCSNNNWECGDITDACGNDWPCGECKWKGCEDHKCK
ncbi:hypothetical protein KJ671_01130 [Patescibacteria group bacterium]|nr:hypothetical protein [Patescibacteria group bacterium]